MGIGVRTSIYSLPDEDEDETKLWYRWVWVQW